VTVVVTGAGGFLGYAIASRLRDRGLRVVGVNRGDYPALDAIGVEQRRGDLGDAAFVHDALADASAVFHVAAKAGVWGPQQEYRRANLDATTHVVDACRAHGIGDLVYTSTPSVVHGGSDLAGIDESAPYAARYATHYPATKAAAERLVLAAHGDTLRTVALRPHLIWGPRDNHLVPRIVDRARRGKLAFVGNGANVVDSVYIDNAADAHVAAFDALRGGGPCGGKPYFITNGEPMAIKSLVNGIVAAAGLPAVERHVPFGVAWTVGALLEGAYSLVGAAAEPPMTRFVAEQLSTSHWYSIEAARRDLGYVPKVTLAEGFERLAAFLRSA